MAVPVSAQEELPDPGITPDSPFYFVDRMFDGFQSREARADERMAEIVAMAQKDHERGLDRAQNGYARVMEKRQRKAENDEDTAEEVAWQTSNHMAVLARVREQVPEQAKAGIDRAMNASAEDRDAALVALEQKDRERATRVADQTLTELMDQIPEQSKERMKQELRVAGQNGENFRLLVSDAPADIADFDYLDIQLSKTRIFRAEENESGFEEREINVTVDLTRLVGEVSTEVLSVELEPGNYSKIELYVDSVEANVDNETANVKVPSEKLQITNSFEIFEDNVTSFVFDINVVKKGPGSEYNLLPVISESGVVGKDLSEDEVTEVESND
ncbi:MAG: DUF4382 domain-containing protein [Nanobdellota archaeon]